MATEAPAPPPPPPMPMNYGSDWRRNEVPPSKEQIEKTQYAMLPDKLLTTLGKDKKPFTYTPQGISSEKGVLDMSEIRSPRMKKRLLANLHAGDEEVTTDDDSRPSSSLAAQPPSTKAPANIYQQPFAPCVLPPLDSVKLKPTSSPVQQKKEVRFAPSPIMFNSDDEELTNLLEKRRKDVESRAKICTNQPDEPEENANTNHDQSDFVECSNDKLLANAASSLQSARAMFGMAPIPGIEQSSPTTLNEGRQEFGLKSLPPPSVFALDANNNPTSYVVDERENVHENVPDTNLVDANSTRMFESPREVHTQQQQQQQEQHQHLHYHERQPQLYTNHQEYSSAFTQPPTHQFENLSLSNEHRAYEAPIVNSHPAPTVYAPQAPEMPAQVHYHHYHPQQQPAQQQQQQQHQQQTFPSQQNPQRMATQSQAQAQVFQHLLDDLQDEIDQFEQISRQAMSPPPGNRAQRMQSLPPETRNYNGNYNGNYNPKPKPFYSSVQAPQMNSAPFQHRSVASPVPYQASPGPLQPNPDFIDSERMIPVSQQIAEREHLAQQCSKQKTRLDDRYINPCTRLIPRRSLLETPRLPEHHLDRTDNGGAKNYDNPEAGRTFLPELGIFSQLPPGAEAPPTTPPTPSKMYYGSLPRKVKLGSGGRITPDGKKINQTDNGRSYLPESGMYSQMPASPTVRQPSQQAQQFSYQQPQQRQQPQQQQQQQAPRMTTFQTAPVPPPKPSLASSMMMSPAPLYQQQQQQQQYHQQQQQQRHQMDDYDENRGYNYESTDSRRELLSNGMFSQMPASTNNRDMRGASVPPSSRFAPQIEPWTPPATPPVPTPINSMEYQRGPKLTPQQIRRLPPSERPPEPNPTKYTGAHNPSRSFRLLQLMTGEDIDNHYAEETAQHHQQQAPAQNNRPQSSQSFFRSAPQPPQAAPAPRQQLQPIYNSDYGTDF